jgi:hypothetical protein
VYPATGPDSLASQCILLELATKPCTGRSACACSAAPAACGAPDGDASCDSSWKGQPAYCLARSAGLLVLAGSRSENYSGVAGWLTILYSRRVARAPLVDVSARWVRENRTSYTGDLLSPKNRSIAHN